MTKQAKVPPKLGPRKVKPTYTTMPIYPYQLVLLHEALAAAKDVSEKVHPTVGRFVNAAIVEKMQQVLATMGGPV